MKKCHSCGAENENESRFCVYCGANLQSEQNMAKKEQAVQKKNQDIVTIAVIAIVALLVIGGIVFFVWRHNDKAGSKDPSESKQVTEEAKDTKDTEGTTKEADKEDFYNDVDLNGIDQVYIKVEGTVATKGNDLVLHFDDPVSLWAYNDSEVAMKRTDVAQLYVISGDQLNSHIGAKVQIKGKLKIGGNNHEEIQVANYEILEEVAAEDTEYELHGYDYIVEDVTWEEANQACIRKGGHLVQINSLDEFEKILEDIAYHQMEDVHFYVGGRREKSEHEYYWRNKNGEKVGALLNPGQGSWASAFWMENEPSFESDDELESYMTLVHYQGAWVFNDVANDITPFYPGKTGYICEFSE